MSRSSQKNGQQTMNELLEAMHKQAIRSMENAYCPYSNLSVGACVLGDNQQLYSGCNVENNVLGLTQCAEQNAIGNLINDGVKRIKTVIIIANRSRPCPPCGSCRQLLYEFSDISLPIYFGDKAHILNRVTLKELLPMPF